MSRSSVCKICLSKRDTDRGDATHVAFAFSCLPECSLGSQCVDKLGSTGSLSFTEIGNIFGSIFWLREVAKVRTHLACVEDYTDSLDDALAVCNPG